MSGRGEAPLIDQHTSGPWTFAHADDDPLEYAYWEFDARRKGYDEWKQHPQAERDAYKASVCAHLARREEHEDPQAEAEVGPPYLNEGEGWENAAARYKHSAEFWRGKYFALRTAHTGALEKIAETMSSDWPERCIENVRIARAALAAAEDAK